MNEPVWALAVRAAGGLSFAFGLLWSLIRL